MTCSRFTKRNFKRTVVNRLRRLFMRDGETATQEQLFRAVSDAAMDVIAEDWMYTKNTIREQDQRTVYYMSMEFLVGRALGNILISLGAVDAVREALEELGVDLNTLEDQEADPALGNGGLGRLAACFLESLATLCCSAVGCGIRYHHGLFRQAIVDGFQNELPDDWLNGGYPFEVRRPEEARVVRFGGYVETIYDSRTGEHRYAHRGGSTVLAIPYDMPVIGYKNRFVNTLRLWDAEAITSDEMDYGTVKKQRRLAEHLTDILYPNDSTDDGKKLRLKQQYFFVSSSVQTAVADFKKNHSDITKLSEKVVFQLNDTHPTMTIPELMRILMDEEGLGWDEAWEVTTKCTAYTNHTVMQEALEKWSVTIFSELLPRIFQIIREIDNRFVHEISIRFPCDSDRVHRMAIIRDGQIRMATMTCSCVISIFLWRFPRSSAVYKE